MDIVLMFLTVIPNSPDCYKVIIFFITCLLTLTFTTIRRETNAIVGYKSLIRFCDVELTVFYGEKNTIQSNLYIKDTDVNLKKCLL